ncbi:MAG TPA: acyl-CoA dehydrogenase [Deltaproteobacteria bacterium]|jgi:alkylation response protein AidB-like acyl-CoA dehydrogenase|nr:acyl-CoA dehydrogenase [Deltaproteobacteria bacterium]
MHFAFTEEQEQLRETARSFLAAHASSEAVRRAMQTEFGFELDAWKRIVSELGWTAILVPETYGGLGLSWVEVVALIEVTGEALLCAPLFSTLCLGTNMLLAGGTEKQKQEWLPKIAEGRAIVTLAWAEDARDPGPDSVHATFRRDAGGFVLSGRKRSVVDGTVADAIVVAAREEGTSGARGIELFLLRGEAAGLVRKTVPTLDATRRMAEIELHDLRLPQDAGMRGGTAALASTLDRAAIALAAEQVGGAQRCLDLAVEYAKGRVQFGRPIGSFQAIKHKCADAMVRVESGRSASYYAACVAAEDAPELAAAASLAKAYCSETYFRCAADCLQIHGGVGFTWEYDVHLHLKRAKAGEAFLGSPSWHRERIAQHMGL